MYAVFDYSFFFLFGTQLIEEIRIYYVHFVGRYLSLLYLS